MRSTPGSVLEEGLRALLDDHSARHPEVDLVVDDDAPVLDGAIALGLPPRPVLPPEACLEGVTDLGTLDWAALTPGPELLGAVEDLWEELTEDLPTACRPVPEDPDDDALLVSDAELLEAVAACDRQLSALTARRDTLAGVFAARRQAEAEQDVADARAASSADGKGRPWATRARSTAPSELAARLGIGDRAAEAVVERGLAAIGRQREVADAMSAGALQTAVGAWLLEELEGVRATALASALERATTQGETALAALRAAQAEAILAGDAPRLSAEELKDRARADRQRLQEQAEAAATEHAEQVTAQVRRELLTRATGLSDWTPREPDGTDAEPPSGTDLTRSDTATDGSADDGGGGEPAAPTSRPTAGAGLGATRHTWKRALTRAVRRADTTAADVRADKARAAASTARWNEDDDQAALLLRGPAEVIAGIAAAMDARAQRRQADARAAERTAAKDGGRPFDRSAVGTLDQHRIAALQEWATAALEISETSGASGTWYPIARTAASKPSVSIVIPWTVLAGVSTVGAELAGYGPIGAAAALRIAADGVWRRVFADPGSGAAVGVEEGAWRPSTALARLVALRWAASTLPGSTRPVGVDVGAGRGGGQLDHVTPYATDEQGRSVGGATEATNLQLLAQVEHLLKQAGEHARAGHGWSVAVDRTGPAGPSGDDGVPPGPAPGDGVVWTSPTGHTYRVRPQQLLDSEGADDSDDADAVSSELPGWTHRLLADVLPAWVGWPPGGAPPDRAEPAAWRQDWASAVLTDDAPEAHGEDEVGDGQEGFLFDDLPAAG